jgi:hypothetical protein
MAGTPKRTTVQRQPMPAISQVPMSGMATVPTLPPAMWALMAKPRRCGGNCSARSPFPTGCWGDAPSRERTLATAKPAKLGAAAWAAMPPPNTSPPAASRIRLEKTRVIAL